MNQYMKTPYAILLVVVMLTSCALQRKVEKGISKDESTEWSHTFVVGTDKTNLPKVLLIGDSHVEGYYPAVVERLKGIAYCSKFTTSRSLGDPVYIDQLALLFKQFNFDIITFNNGLHGSGYKIEEYSRDIPFVYELLKSKSRKAIIWVNTTAWRMKEKPDEFKAIKLITERNNLVKEFTSNNQIPLIDFYSISIANKDYYSQDYLHFNNRGVTAQAELICTEINRILKK